VKKKKPVGIVDPFNAPKNRPPIPSPYDDPYGTAEEEAHLRPKPMLDLDGDSYIIRFLGGVTPDTATKALVELLYDVNAEHQEYLTRNGVSTDSTSQHPCMALTHNGKTVHVYTDEPNEIAVFRRIGATLWGLPNKQVLRTHQVKIIKRG
jgi:hypothetical protein